ncbi:MAG: hypothetical protein ACU0AY_19570 [Marinibacterium profundimaris]
MTREAVDPATGEQVSTADYSQLGWLLITTAVIGVVAPLLTILFIQNSRFRTTE